MLLSRIAEEIFLSGVKSVLPSALIPREVKLSGNSLVISEHIFPLGITNNIYVIGAGKASALMAVEIENILGNRITGGHVIVKHGYSASLKHIKVTEAGHPVPDKYGFEATAALIDIAVKAGKDDLVICLISGGGSALLADHPEGATPADMMKLNELLVNCGASISEINAVRKHLSLVKGGQLARTVFPATLVSLILSDVPGDPFEVIASGPTTPDSTTFNQALDILDNYSLKPLFPAVLLKYLEDGAAGLHPETPDVEDPVFSSTLNMLIGSNRTALEAARLKALEFNMNALIIESKLQGDVISVADYLVETAVQFKADENEVKPVCLLFGGETTVRMSGTGTGGRNQHLALLTAILLKDMTGITILSGGTDGNDGPTNAAGAVVTPETCKHAVSKGIIPEDYIRRFDSWNFFRKAGGHIITGPTMTNVMDIIVIIVE